MEGLKGKKILVTGGAGFIGSHLVLELIKNNTKVSVIDIKADPKSFFSLNNLAKSAYFEILDIRNKKKVQDLFDKFNFDFIFHLAAESIVEKAFNDPYSAFETNIMGTVNILEASRRINSVKGIIVASSDKAYGKTKKAYTEDSPLRADHPYDVSKASADLISQAYFATYGLPVVVTRFGNVYGEGDLHFDRIIPGICKAIINNEILEIRSDGKYVRDYIYVKDVVDGYILLLKKIGKIYGQVFNFSSSDALSVLQVIEVAKKSIGKKINYKILNIAKNEIPYQHLNDLKIRKLSWRPKRNLGSTFKQVLNWYKYDFYGN